MGGSAARGTRYSAGRLRRGTVVWVNLEDAHPPELGKTRPAVIVSNTEQNGVLASVVVVPLSSRAPAIWPLRVAIPATGQLKRSFAITPGIRQVSNARLLRAEGAVPAAVIDQLSEAIDAYLRD